MTHTLQDVMRGLGRHLADVRMQLGVTQEVLHERAGIAQADISRFETGNSNPTMQTLIRIADALGCRLEVRFVPDKQES